MLGPFAVGKTSLVQRIVRGTFPEGYCSTLGVRIDRKRVSSSGRDLDLIIWDLHGEDEFQKIRSSYLRGAAGLLLVVDGTRRSTLDQVTRLRETADPTGGTPFVLAINKVDLTDEWQVDNDAVGKLEETGWPVVRTSAKTGQGVDDAFSALARALLNR